MGFGGVAAFTQLSDTPHNYAGQALKALGVNAGEDGLEFAVAVPPLTLGSGFNFLRVSQIGGQPFAEWADIQGLIIALTGAVNRIVTLPELVAPVPVASQMALAASSPPGRTALPSLPAPVPAAAVAVTSGAALASPVVPALAAPVPGVSATAVIV